MNCDFETICLYLEKKLSPGKQLELLDHLNTCYQCQKIAHLLKRNLDAESWWRDMVKAAPENHWALSRRHLTHTRN